MNNRSPDMADSIHNFKKHLLCAIIWNEQIETSEEFHFYRSAISVPIHANTHRQTPAPS